MTHESNAATLRSAAKECDFSLFVAQLLAIVHHRIPSGITTSTLKVFYSQEMSTKCSVTLNNATESNMKQWRHGRTKMPASKLVSHCDARELRGLYTLT